MKKQKFSWNMGRDAYDTMHDVANISINEDLSALLETIACKIFFEKYGRRCPSGKIAQDENDVVTLTIGSGKGDDKEVQFAKFEGDHLVEIVIPYSKDYFNGRGINPVKPFVTGRFACEYLRKASFPGFTNFGKGTLQYAFDLKTLVVPDLESAGDSVLRFAQLEKLDAPKLKKVGDHFLYHNEGMRSFNAPNIKTFGKNSLYNNDGIYALYLPLVRKLPNGFMFANTRLENVYMPKLQEVGTDCHPLFYDIVLANRAKHK